MDMLSPVFHDNLSFSLLCIDGVTVHQLAVFNAFELTLSCKHPFLLIPPTLRDGFCWLPRHHFRCHSRKIRHALEGICVASIPLVLHPYVKWCVLLFLYLFRVHVIGLKTRLTCASVTTTSPSYPYLSQQPILMDSRQRSRVSHRVLQQSG